VTALTTLVDRTSAFVDFFPFRTAFPGSASTTSLSEPAQASLTLRPARLLANSSWKSHTSCSQNHLESDSEIIFSGPESYTVKTTSTLQSAGQTKTTHMTRTGKWLSADCGDIKPPSIEK
jgi:hypothetical protein